MYFYVWLQLLLIEKLKEVGKAVLFGAAFFLRGAASAKPEAAILHKGNYPSFFFASNSYLNKKSFYCCC